MAVSACIPILHGKQHGSRCPLHASMRPPLPALVLSVSWMLAILTEVADILLVFKSYADFIYFTFL